MACTSGGVDADAHPPLAEVGAVDDDGDAGAADAVQGGHQDVEVVDPGVLV